MRTLSLLVAVWVLFCGARASHGMATEQVGPDSAQPHPTTAQPGWPAGIIKLLEHESRVYSIWVNGNENFYFKASQDEINELIQRFSQMRMRDHELRIKVGKKHVKPFDGEQIAYNVNFHLLEGIALFMTRMGEGPQTNEPTLTLYLDPADDQVLVDRLTIPDHIIINSEVDLIESKGEATKPERQVWCALVQFDDASPAADFEQGLSTKVMFWEKDVKDGVKLGEVDRKGHFHAAFSDKEIGDLKAGDAWLTLTVGNWLTQARRDHPKLGVEKLVLDQTKVQPIRIGKPRPFYGRILFEDGSAPDLNPAPWPGAEIKVEFPYSGGGPIDSDGYFQVYFTGEQYEKIKARKVRKNIYVPSYERKGGSTALFAFPASELSQEKAKAGVVSIPKPGPRKDVESEQANKPAFKGMELYSWKPVGKDWRFSLLVGTNALKPTSKITASDTTIVGVDNLKQKLSSLAKGEQVFWRNMAKEPVPHKMIKDLNTFCTEFDIKLEKP